MILRKRSEKLVSHPQGGGGGGGENGFKVTGIIEGFFGV